MCPLHGIHAQKCIKEGCKTAFFWLWIFCAQINTTASENPVKCQLRLDLVAALVKELGRDNASKSASISLSVSSSHFNKSLKLTNEIESMCDVIVSVHLHTCIILAPYSEMLRKIMEQTWYKRFLSPPFLKQRLMPHLHEKGNMFSIISVSFHIKRQCTKSPRLPRMTERF